jgi:DNA-binding PadR family transcriptional regulator
MEGRKPMAAKAKKAQSGKAPAAELGPLSLMRAKVLKQVELLGEDAFGYRVLQVLMQQTGQWIDPSQVYGTLRGLEHDMLIAYSHTRPSSERGPPMKVFKLTPAGRASLEATAAYHRGLFEYLTEKKR